jgi:hypothetical protein
MTAMKKLLKFGKASAALRSVKDGIVNGLIHVGGWIVVKSLKVAPSLMEIGAYVLVTVGLAHAWSPLGWIAAGLSLWIVAHGSSS